jgi:ribosomal protein L37AE/L43A
MAMFDDCPNCGSRQVSLIDDDTATCSECAHAWDVNTGKTAG